MQTIEITFSDLLDILKEYDEDNYEAKPIDAINFCEHIFKKYTSKSWQ